MTHTAPNARHTSMSIIHLAREGNLSFWVREGTILDYVLSGMWFVRLVPHQQRVPVSSQCTCPPPPPPLLQATAPSLALALMFVLMVVVIMVLVLLLVCRTQLCQMRRDRVKSDCDKSVYDDAFSQQAAAVIHSEQALAAAQASLAAEVDKVTDLQLQLMLCSLECEQQQLQAHIAIQDAHSLLDKNDILVAKLASAEDVSFVAPNVLPFMPQS